MKKANNRHAYQDWLLKHGFERIGAGTHAGIFAKPGHDRVIKIGHDGDGWAAYIQWAANNGYMGTLAPMVYRFKSHNGFYVAVVERLVCTLCSYSALNRSNPEQLKVMQYAETCTYDFITPDPTIHSEIFKFVRALKAADMVNDLHPANYMLRKDGQLVFTDPNCRVSNVGMSLNFQSTRERTLT